MPIFLLILGCVCLVSRGNDHEYSAETQNRFRQEAEVHLVNEALFRRYLEALYYAEGDGKPLQQERIDRLRSKLHETDWSNVNVPYILFDVAHNLLKKGEATVTELTSCSYSPNEQWVKFILEKANSPLTPYEQKALDIVEFSAACSAAYIRRPMKNEQQIELRNYFWNKYKNSGSLDTRSLGNAAFLGEPRVAKEASAKVLSILNSEDPNTHKISLVDLIETLKRFDTRHLPHNEREEYSKQVKTTFDLIAKSPKIKNRIKRWLPSEYGSFIGQ